MPASDPVKYNVCCPGLAAHPAAAIKLPVPGAVVWKRVARLGQPSLSRPLCAPGDIHSCCKGGGRGPGACSQREPLPQSWPPWALPAFISHLPLCVSPPSLSSLVSCQKWPLCSLPRPPPWPGLSFPTQAWPPGPQPSVGTDRIRVRTIQVRGLQEGTALSIRG